MAVDTGLGLTALVTVVLAGAVGTLSYLRTTDTDLRVEIRRDQYITDNNSITYIKTIFASNFTTTIQIP